MPRILDRGSVGIVDLGPAGDARLHHVAFGIVGQLVFKVRHELRAFRAGSDEAHLTLEDRPGLRQFIDAQLADDPADPCHARIVLLCKLRAPRFGIDAHGAQFYEIERLTIEPDAGLTEKCRALAVDLHKDGKKDNDRQGEREQQQAGGNVKNTLGRARHCAAGRETVRENQPARIDRVEIDPAGLALDERREFIDVDAGRLDPQQILERQRVAPFLQRQHHFADPEILNIARQVADRIAVDRLDHHGCRTAHADIADDRKSRFGLFAQFAQSLGPSACPQDENAPPEGCRAKKAAKQQPDQDQRTHREEHRVEQVRPP